MKATKVKQDQHGLYVRTGGNLYRPVITKHSYPMVHRPLRDDGRSAFEEGEEVRARHLSQSPFAKIISASGVEEWWHSHGCYIDEQGKNKPSASCWIPKGETK